ncbi:MAG: tyrosine-protein phosphatase [Dehalococcoidia bacterium]
MTETYNRHIGLESVINFRDLGGYATRDGKTVAWRRIFRSGNLAELSPADSARLTEELSLKAILDLRSDMETAKGICPLSQSGVHYVNLPLMTDGGNREEEDRLFSQMTNLGQFYIHLLGHPEFGKGLVETLEFIVERDKHPLVFHCAVGKDRTGILTAILLSVLGVTEEDIIEDYTLSAPYMVGLLEEFNSNPELVREHGHLPAYFWEASAESMELFLSTLQREYGSVEEYLYAHGAKPALIEKLREVLLV